MIMLHWAAIHTALFLCILLCFIIAFFKLSSNSELDFEDVEKPKVHHTASNQSVLETRGKNYVVKKSSNTKVDGKMTILMMLEQIRTLN